MSNAMTEEGFAEFRRQTYEDRLAEMLSSITFYMDRPIDEDVVKIRIEMSMRDGSVWLKAFKFTETELASEFGRSVIASKSN